MRYTGARKVRRLPGGHTPAVQVAAEFSGAMDVSMLGTTWDEPTGGAEVTLGGEAVTFGGEEVTW